MHVSQLQELGKGSVKRVQPLVSHGAQGQHCAPYKELKSYLALPMGPWELTAIL